MAVRLGDDEIALLLSSEISHGARVLYVFLRSRMDFKTGIVGDRVVMSYQAMREAIEYRPPARSKAGSVIPTTGYLRARLEELKKAGAVTLLPGGRFKKMRFELPLASIRPNEERHVERHGTATCAKPATARVSGSTTTCHSDTHSDIHLVKNKYPSLREGAQPSCADDLKARIFGSGLDWLSEASDRPKDKLRALVGRWIRDHGERAVLGVMHEAHEAQPVEPVQWITKALGQQQRRASFSARVDDADFGESIIPPEVAALMQQMGGGDD